MKKITDALISDAIWLCKKYEIASPPLFQRMLSLDYDTADAIFFALEQMEVIINAVDQFDGFECIRIGEVNQEKLAEFSKN